MATAYQLRCLIQQVNACERFQVEHGGATLELSPFGVMLPNFRKADDPSMRWEAEYGIAARGEHHVGNGE